MKFESKIWILDVVSSQEQGGQTVGNPCFMCRQLAVEIVDRIHPYLSRAMNIAADLAILTYLATYLPAGNPTYLPNYRFQARTWTAEY